VFKNKKSSIKKPIDKGVYAWNSLHAGSFLVFMEELKECYKFIFLPGPSYMYLTPETFDTSLRNNILEFVEPLPDEIYEETVSLTEKSVDLSSSKSETILDETHTKPK